MNKASVTKNDGFEITRYVLTPEERKRLSVPRDSFDPIPGTSWVPLSEVAKRQLREAKKMRPR
jgi:hypothetical protein